MVQIIYSSYVTLWVIISLLTSLASISYRQICEKIVMEIKKKKLLKVVFPSKHCSDEQKEINDNQN